MTMAMGRFDEDDRTWDWGNQKTQMKLEKGEEVKEYLIQDGLSTLDPISAKKKK